MKYIKEPHFTLSLKEGVRCGVSGKVFWQIATDHKPLQGAKMGLMFQKVVIPVLNIPVLQNSYLDQWHIISAVLLLLLLLCDSCNNKNSFKFHLTEMYNYKVLKI